MEPDQPGMAIVGAGECGARAALTFSEQAYAGRATLIGAERRRPYERPPLSTALGPRCEELTLKPIARQACPPREALQSPEVRLKKLLVSASASKALLLRRRRSRRRPPTVKARSGVKSA